jgi:preprotein translocase subunit SecY
MVLATVLVVTAFVVFMERGQRRITVNYARKQGGAGRAYMNQSSHLPLKINMSGVIPPIFASSLIMFPATAAAWFNNSSEIALVADPDCPALGPGEPLHMVIYAAMIIGFAFFYTALVFNSQETADNLKKSGH